MWRCLAQQDITRSMGSYPLEEKPIHYYTGVWREEIYNGSLSYYSPEEVNYTVKDVNVKKFKH